jgi:photosystem II stability/assembly factor-like uncharacterized protein
MLADMGLGRRLPKLFATSALAAVVGSVGTADGAVGKWEPRGLADVDLGAVVVDSTNPNSVYAGGRGLFRSRNGGQSWSEVSTGISFVDDEQVYALAIESESPAVVYAGTYEGRILVTARDRPTAHVVKGPSIPFAGAARNWGSVFSIAVDPVRRGTVYVGTETGQLFKTTTGGRAWESADAGLVHHDINTLAVDPTRTATLYAGTFFGLYKSTDGGSHWRAVSSMTKRIYAIAVDRKSRTVYAGTQGSGVWASRDGGNSWLPVTAYVPRLRNALISSLVVDEQANVVFAGTRSRGVFWSTTSGMRWKTVGTGLNDVRVNSLALAQGRLYAATSNGIFTTRSPG